MVVLILEVTRSLSVWCIDVGPSGSDVDIAEKRVRSSSDDVVGRWLFVTSV